MAAISGQITVTTAGTAVQGPSTPRGRYFGIKAHPDNTGVVYVGNDGEGDVSSSNGFPLDGGGVVMDVLEVAGGDLSGLWFDAATNGDKVCWVLLGGKMG